MNAVFADAFYWIASINKNDAWHQQVIRWTYENTDVQLVTTEEVLTEVLSFYSKGGVSVRQTSVNLVKYAIAQANVTVVPQTHDSFLKGLSLFENRSDKGYSLIDCISMNTMQQMEIPQVLTHDHHFA